MTVKEPVVSPALQVTRVVPTGNRTETVSVPVAVPPGSHVTVILPFPWGFVAVTV